MSFALKFTIVALFSQRSEAHATLRGPESRAPVPVCERNSEKSPPPARHRVRVHTGGGVRCDPITGRFGLN